MAERGAFCTAADAGVLVPLFSIPSRQSWGIGEIADLPPFARWLVGGGAGPGPAAAGQRDGGRAELAVFGAERDGDRPDLHRAPLVEEFADAGGEAALDRRIARG